MKCSIRREGSQGSVEHLVKTKMTTETVAGIILRKLEKGENYITVDFEGAVIFNNMRGASPRFVLFFFSASIFSYSVVFFLLV